MTANATSPITMLDVRGSSRRSSTKIPNAASTNPIHHNGESWTISPAGPAWYG